MSDQKDDTNPNIPRFSGAQAYQRIKELTSQLDANPDDPAAKDEFDRLMKYIGNNPNIAAEFTRLRTSDAEIAAEVAGLGKDSEASQSPKSAPSNPEKKYVTTASLDFGKVREKASQGFGVYSSNVRAPTTEPEVKPAENKSKEYTGRWIGWSWSGEVIDFWSDLIEGHGAEKEAFIHAYRKSIASRKITKVLSGPQQAALGVIDIRWQDFDVFRWNVANAALRTDQIGDDLYVSWRVFVAEPISWRRIIMWLVGCLLAAIFLTVGFNLQAYTQYNQYYGSATNPLIQSTFETFIKIAIGSGIYLIIVGLFRRNGDWLGMFRRPLDEFDRDDAMAAGHVIHKSVLQAADTIGIDSMTLAPRHSEPSDRPRASRRI